MFLFEPSYGWGQILHLRAGTPWIFCSCNRFVLISIKVAVGTSLHSVGDKECSYLYFKAHIAWYIPFKAQYRWAFIQLLQCICELNMFLYQFLHSVVPVVGLIEAINICIGNIFTTIISYDMHSNRLYWCAKRRSTNWGPLLLTSINLNPNLDKQLQALCSVAQTYLSILKRQRFGNG